MNTSIPIEGSRVIAAMTPPTSKAPFNRGELILRATDGALVRARTYTSEGCAEGPALDMDDVQGLIQAGQATDLAALASIAAVSGASLWVLRGGLPRRDRALADLQMSGLLVHSPLVGQDDARLCIVKEGEAQASAMRDRWRDEAMVLAKGHAKSGEWDLAMTHAEIAQAVCRGLDPEVLGLLSLTCERCGRGERAAGLLVMARRSRGEEFEAQVMSAREHLRVALGTGRSARTQPHAGLHAALRGRFPRLAQSLGKPRSSRLAAY